MARREKAPEPVSDSFFLKSPLPEKLSADESAQVDEIRKYFDELKSKLYYSEPIISEKHDEAPDDTERDVLAEDLSLLDKEDTRTPVPEVQRTTSKETTPPPVSTSSNEAPPELFMDKPLVDQFADALAARKISPSAQVLVAQFSDQYVSAKGFVRAKKTEAAHEAYTSMLRLYQELNTQDIPTVHKQIAHHGLEEIYDTLSRQDLHEPISKGTFVTLILASVLVLLCGVVLVLNPSISGLAVLEHSTPTYTGPSSFEIFGPRRIELGPYFGMNPEHLTLLATRSIHVDVQVDKEGIIVVPSPDFSGDETVHVIAVNTRVEPYLMTKVPLTLIVR